MIMRAFMNDTEPLVIDQLVKTTYPLPGEPVGATYILVNEDAVHYYVVRQHGSGIVHRLPKRNVVDATKYAVQS